jgi:hypothetical protein
LRGKLIVIPAEFITDHASVSRLPLIAGGRGIRSATVHDFGYQFGYCILESSIRQLVDQLR